MLELQEASEKALFCAPKGGHLGATCRAAKHRGEGNHKKLAKIMAGVAGAGIRGIFQRGQENLHEGGKLQDMNPPSRIDSGVIRKGRRSHPQFQRDSPAPRGTVSMMVVADIFPHPECAHCTASC